MRNRAGIIQRFPTGTDEVEYSDVTETESRRGCGLGRSGHRQGDIPAFSPGGIRDEEVAYRELFLQRAISTEQIFLRISTDLPSGGCHSGGGKAPKNVIK